MTHCYCCVGHQISQRVADSEDRQSKNGVREAEDVADGLRSRKSAISLGDRLAQSHLKDANDFVHDHQNPYHRNEEPDEAQDDATAMCRMLKQVKGEGSYDKSAGERDHGVPPSQIFDCE